MSIAVRQALLGGVLVVAVTLLGSTGASAAGPAVQVGQPFSNQPPSIAVDASGNALIAWNDDKDLAGANNFVQYCVISVGATGCRSSGKLVPADGAQAIDGVQAIVDGGTYVILADVFGAQGAEAGDYEPEQEWQSTDGGATFSIVDGGKSVSSANLSADTGPLNAVIMPGTGVLGFGWETAAGPPTFNAFPLASPPECSKASPCSFATLEPNTNPDVLTNGGGTLAAEAGASPGVLGVYSTLFNDGGPFSCPSSTPDGMAFVYGAGNQGATDSFNVTPGSTNTAWRVPATQGECGVHNFTAGGGPGGFGILGDNEGTGTTFYQRFDPTNITFADMPKVTVAKQGEVNPSISQDGAGGVYATYMSDGSGGPIVLSYSSDGGTTWSGPNVLHSFDGLDHPKSAVNGAGQGWVTWTKGGSVFAESFTAADAVPPPAATTAQTTQGGQVQLEGSGSSNGKTITITVTCNTLPCTFTITITDPSAHQASISRVERTKAKPATLAHGTFTLHKGGPQMVKLRLTKAGKKYMASHHGTVQLSAAVSQTIAGHKMNLTKTIKVKISKPKPKHKKK